MEYVVVFLLAIGLGFLFSLVMALPAMWLWNWLMPAIFGLTEITFWQAWGLLFLCSLLFKSHSSSSSSKCD